MELHHKKHHQAYVNGLNAAEQQYASAATPRAKIALQAAIKFNGGGTPRITYHIFPRSLRVNLGHINHSLFWKNMAPPRHTNPERTAQYEANIGGVLKNGPLKTEIDRQFGSLDALKKEFNTTAAAIQGSGWCWLSLNPNGSLSIETTPNQDPLLCESSIVPLQNISSLYPPTAGVPLIGVDVWEHAYYLQYKNVRPDVCTPHPSVLFTYSQPTSSVPQCHLGSHQLRGGRAALRLQELRPLGEL